MLITAIIGWNLARKGDWVFGRDKDSDGQAKHDVVMFFGGRM